jgi:hypothetical protein
MTTEQLFEYLNTHYEFHPLKGTLHRVLSDSYTAANQRRFDRGEGFELDKRFKRKTPKKELKKITGTTITIDGKRYSVAKICVFMHKGVMPTSVNFRNGDTTDLRIDNLNFTFN